MCESTESSRETIESSRETEESSREIICRPRETESLCAKSYFFARAAKSLHAGRRTVSRGLSELRADYKNSSRETLQQQFYFLADSLIFLLLTANCFMFFGVL